jgi:glycosyltransferase involved in cell wall biosynthesis
VHVAFFNRCFYPETTATGQLLTELCEDLVRLHGLRVSVVVGKPLQPATALPNPGPGVLVTRESCRGVEVLRARGTRFSKDRFVGRFSNYVSYFLSACYAGQRLDRPDLVVGLTDPPIIGLAALLAAKRHGARFVFLCEDLFPEVGRLLEDFHSRLVDRSLDWTNRLLITTADRVVAVGETMRDRLVRDKGAEPGKVSVIHNWADCSTVVPGTKRNAFSVASGLAEAFVVMHSGNVGLSQDLDIMLDAALHLRSYPEIVFAIVGDGAKRAALEERVRSNGLTNVRFFPYQPKELLHESFASADVFVISLRRGLAGCIVPSKLYGILAAGRPYVGAVEDACEVAAITRRHDCGLLARPGDGRDLADKILTLYDDRALAYQLGSNARRAAFEFDRAPQVRAYAELFQHLGRCHERASHAVAREVWNQ